ncbi:hypothetical protein ACH8ZP_02585 [Chlamydia pneumoniae]|uniref:Inner membrane protein n=1 Tax=Chlamydia pneumoniae TaxID=83558 RepID=Q9Z829_CHLPN|nr:hypothetical protein [Chlamydia pneumoniae]AAD18663.1 hypothetical protein CPn_0523 [Chlamydia pneumoniae CWL029]AAF38096.1 hypothetical protein CP_0230 [Chlamydia pneumoniae AR39]CRI33034.1 Uncharacterized protein BN1224_Wien1_A_05410 [Chlamydia pneumoniae]CRI35897.1 Uncharacterized protein BN1224_CM1_A_05440 [Chlamydia pneumoniae]CRI37024.1 Uncharacterized protein BN1224_CV14_A_05430 [Chlamydia pneumoniae]
MASSATPGFDGTAPSLFPPATRPRYNFKLALFVTIAIALVWIALIATTIAIGLCIHPLCSFIFLTAIPLYFISRYICSHYARNVYIALDVVPDHSKLQDMRSHSPIFSDR